MARLLLLLPSATYRADDFLAAAGVLGADVVVGSEFRQAMAATMGDRALVVPLADPEAAVAAIVALHRRSPLDAVVAVDDQGVLVAALAGERLGLKHNPPDAVAATRDKLAMRTRLAGSGVAQPDWRAANSPGEVRDAVLDLGPPVVVKPLSLSASRGVIRADDPAQAEAAADRIEAILAGEGTEDRRLLVERFVAGPEVAVEAILRDGSLEVLAVFDKPDPLDGPFFEETIYVTPSRQPATVQSNIAEAAARAAAALGLREGPIHAELRLPVGAAGAGPVLLELAARSIGGLCARSLRFGLGVSLEEVILAHALDLDVDTRRETVASGVMMLPIAAAGVLREVKGQDQARAVPGIVGLELSINPGRPVRPLPEADRYLGFLFAKGADAAAVEAALRAAHACLDVVVA
ncbi:MAG TPA: ATP-grasp domain-containing protein [Acidimicrobiales bacterium]|nr:ATP-grasp domain-containing protein [Acidimicrobiales bacterium]